MAEETTIAELPVTELPDAETPDTETPVPLPQEVVITDAGPCKKHVKVTVAREAIDARLEEKYSDLMVKAPVQLNGFRVGKAPRKIVEKRYHKEVYAEVKTEILMASLEQLAEEQTLSPLSPPELDPNAVLIPDEGPMVYEFNIEVRPEFDLPEYKNLKLRKPTHVFSDAEVVTEKQRMLEPYGQVIVKGGAHPAVALNDFVTADVVIKMGDKELNKVNEIRVRVDRQLALADGVAENFGKVMVGAKTGDTRTVDIKLSQEIQTESMRGVKVQAAFTVKEIKVVRQPELTPTVLAEFDVRNEAQLDELVRKRLERFMEYTQRQTARTQVLEKLAGNANWDLPKDLLVRQARKTLQRRVMEMRSSGMSDDQIRSRQRMLEQDVLRSTASALKEHFVLQKVAETEKLEIEDADIDDEIDRIAEQNGESPRKVRARMDKEDLLEALATELLERKALDFLLTTAEYEEYEFNPLKQEADEVSTMDATAAPESSQPVPTS